MQGDELRAARARLKLTREQLGAAVGLSGRRRRGQQVSAWEAGSVAIPARVALLVECFLQGARPSTWPDED